MIEYTALELEKELHSAYGETAVFHEGQKEAVTAVLDGKRTLVVQKTGWGKSLVYFLATKIIRRHTGKLALIISPLLVLMDNQIDSAKRLGLNVKTINSTNEDEWDLIISQAVKGNADALIISPERLANEDFKQKLRDGISGRIGLFVVDEAHCISDWGHDFRPDYRRIVSLITQLPRTVPVLATTATANERVIRDIQAQLGEDLEISRGSLLRESIAIQTIPLNTREERLAWLAEHIEEFPGSGVVYCLTVNDCILVKRFLSEKGVSCRSYFSDMASDAKKEAIQLFMNNQIKVLSATVAFGMGFDKDDIGFVIHFQRPGNLIAYYQQIGRAGRQIPRAYAVMLYGEEDDIINDYFINTAFPTQEMMSSVIRVLEQHPGLGKNGIQEFTDIRQSNIEKCLKYLEVNGDIYSEDSKYYKTPKKWVPDLERSKRVTAIRRKEQERMIEFCETKTCFMEYIAREMDDETACACGKCSNCLGRPIFDPGVTKEGVTQAGLFIREDYNVIPARKKWPARSCSEDGKLSIPLGWLVRDGLVLSNYGDSGWGREVSADKYENGYFREELVDASVRLLKDLVAEKNYTALTYIPSLRRPELVKGFAERLAKKLGLEFFTALKKTNAAACQKNMHNSYSQWKNAMESFEVVETRPGNTILVDDMVDSRWTFTCCGCKMLKAGNGGIFPYALANSAGRGDQEE